MPIKLSTPIFELFTLDKSDKRYKNDGEPTTVLIKQAAQYEHEYRQQIFATMERKFSDLEPDTTSLVQTANMEELKRIETWLTLCECNLMDEDGKKALFPSKKGPDGQMGLTMTRQQFDEAWGKLPPDVANEIHEKVLEVNIMWGPRGG